MLYDPTDTWNKLVSTVGSDPKDTQNCIQFSLGISNKPSKANSDIIIKLEFKDLADIEPINTAVKKLLETATNPFGKAVVDIKKSYDPKLSFIGYTPIDQNIDIEVVLYRIQNIVEQFLDYYSKGRLSIESAARAVVISPVATQHKANDFEMVAALQASDPIIEIKYSVLKDLLHHQSLENALRTKSFQDLKDIREQIFQRLDKASSDYSHSDKIWTESTAQRTIIPSKADPVIRLPLKKFDECIDAVLVEHSITDRQIITTYIEGILDLIEARKEQANLRAR